MSEYPIIYLKAWEEDRVEQIFKAVSHSYYKDELPLVMWTATRGFYTSTDSLSHTGAPGSSGSESTEPVSAVRYIASQSEDAIYIMKDLPGFFERDTMLVRILRDLYYHLLDRKTLVVLCHPVLKIPEVLKKEVFLIELDLPDEREISGYFDYTLSSRNIARTIPDDQVAQYASAMRGLSLNEVRHLTLRLVSENKLGSEDALESIYDEKAQVLLKESCLRVVTVRPSVSSIGGLENLKEWVSVRGKLFSKKALEAGIPTPSGVLFMGVSGCGKSLAAKAIASAWGLQLVRMDMNLILSGAYGSPEFAFDQACRVAESIAPVVLWIDEIENAFGYDESPASGGNINIFSGFLTWMQEKPASVFVAATANRIQKLPPEMLRKGRFDQLFFLDLPNKQERAEIIRVHIEQNGGNPFNFDTEVLTALTKGRSGAEIEQAIKAARIDAFAENRIFTQRDISRNSSRMVPLSVTMQEQIKELRYWSNNRATPASQRDGDQQAPGK